MNGTGSTPGGPTPAVSLSRGGGRDFRRQAARLAPAAAPVLLLLAVYAPVGGFAFLGYDDNRYVTANVFVRQGITAASLRWALTTTWDGNWFPLTWLSHLLDVELFGVRPGGPHVVNLLLHLANALLLAGLLRSLTGRRLASLAAAGLFAAHPLQVETVAWISQRRSLLMLLFGLLALHAHVARARRPSAARATAVAALFACGLASKALLVTLPAVMLLLDFWPLGRLRAGARPLRPLLEKLPLLLLALPAGAVAIWAQRSSGAMPLEARIGAGEKALHAVTSWGWYLGKALWPARLAVFYPWPAGGWSAPRALLAAAALAALALAAALLRRRAPALLAGGGWFLVALLPLAGILQVGEQAWADRYAYLALPGLAVAATWGVAAVPGARFARWRPAAALAVLLALAAAARAQVRHWRDNETLFRRAVAVTEGNFVAEKNLGTVLLEQGHLEEATAHLREAVRLQPGEALARFDLGLALLRAGRLEEAVTVYRAALRLDPREYQAQHNLGLALDRLGRREEAVAALREAVRLRPGQVSSLSALGGVLLQLGRPAEAVEALERAARLDPRDPFVRGTLALARAQLARRPGGEGAPAP